MYSEKSLLKKLQEGRKAQTPLLLVADAIITTIICLQNFGKIQENRSERTVTCNEENPQLVCK